MKPFIKSLLARRSSSSLNTALQSNSSPSHRPPTIHEGHTGQVFSVAFSPDGKSVASSSSDMTVRIWETHTPSPIGKPLVGHTSFIWSISYAPLGDIIASGSSDDTIRLWDVSTGLQLGGPLKNENTLLSVAFSPNASLIASGSDVSVHLDGPGLLRPGSDPYTIRLWDVRRRVPASNPLRGHTDGALSVCFSPDSTWVLSGSCDKAIRVWDVEYGITTLGPLVEHTDSVSAAFSPDGSQIVSCSGDRTLRLWDFRSGRSIGEPYKGHTNRVYSVAFSPDGKYVVSGGLDETVRLWDVRTGRQVIQPFKEHTLSVHSVAFSPCGQWILSGSDDYNVIVRSIFGNNAEPSNPLESSVISQDKVKNEATHIVVHQMSTHQILNCLIAAGCTDLSSQMDAQQTTAMIISGGGFGDIWMGQMNNGVKVAIKAWRTNALEQCDYKTIKRTARELFYWSRMKHKNVHQLMGVIMFRDQYLGMVSEWMENGNLHEYLRKHPNADRYRLCIDVASGLEYMHTQDTIHGDLKAVNVLVSSEGVARLSDFDFSVLLEASSLVFTESSNTRSGSVRWAAPELLVSNVPKRTKPSDVYALGMTMLEIFIGDVPYPTCRVDYNVIITVTQGTLPTRPINQLKDDQQGNLVWQTLLQCWRRKPSQRPSARLVVNIVRCLALRGSQDY